jgi:hypothetical protein
VGVCVFSVYIYIDSRAWKKTGSATELREVVKTDLQPSSIIFISFGLVL